MYKWYRCGESVCRKLRMERGEGGGDLRSLRHTEGNTDKGA